MQQLELLPPARSPCDHTPVFMPNPIESRKAIRNFIAKARNATFLPWSADTAEMYQETLLPQTATILPRDDAAKLLAEFNTEIARLSERRPCKHHMGINQEAKSLAARTGLRWQACKQWMEHIGIRSVPDLHVRYPNIEHAECLQRGASEIEDFICQ